MTLTFAVHRLPHDPRGEWASGIEDGDRFYPSIHFRCRRAAQRDAAAMTAASRPTRSSQMSCTNSFVAADNPSP
jgi:hypothetical protein